MNQADTPFQALRSSADEAAVAAIEQLVREAPDHALYRTNALAFAARNGLDEEPVIAAFLHAARLGLFELSWNVLCPGCGGVLDAETTLKSVNRAEYSCALCAAGYEPTLDEMVEVTFTVSPRVRRVAAHDPNSLPLWDYCRQTLDRALRAGRRPCRLRPREGAFPRPDRDRGGRGRGRRENHRRCRDGDVSDAGSGGRCRLAHARRDAIPQRRAKARGPAAQDRHPRGTVPRGHAQRPPGLFRADGEYRGARPGPCRLAIDLCDRRGDRECGIVAASGSQRPKADPATRRAARHRRRDGGLRAALSPMNGTALWPALPYPTWRETAATLQLWTQIVGKVRLTLTPWANHGWQVPLYVTARGLGTSPIPVGGEILELEFDFIGHRLAARTSRGEERTLALEPQTVADFHRALMEVLGGLGVAVAIKEMPNEVANPIRFSQDRVHAAYDAAAAHRFWRALVQADRIL